MARAFAHGTPAARGRSRIPAAALFVAVLAALSVMAPLAECRLPSLFVIPGDVLTVLHVHGDYADVAYRNPRTGREASGWLRLDRLAAIAGPAADSAVVPDAQPATPERR